VSDKGINIFNSGSLVGTVRVGKKPIQMQGISYVVKFGEFFAIVAADSVNLKVTGTIERVDDSRSITQGASITQHPTNGGFLSGLLRGLCLPKRVCLNKVPPPLASL
jgi:hypothetical protein